MNVFNPLQKMNDGNHRYPGLLSAAVVILVWFFIIPEALYRVIMKLRLIVPINDSDICFYICAIGI